MRDIPDPSVHHQRQQQVVDHVARLLRDERLRLDTTAGRPSVTTLARDVLPGDQALLVKHRMIELGLFDRDLQRRMPPGLTLDVTLSQQGLFGGKTPVGKLRVVTASPTDALLQGGTPAPLDRAAVQKLLAGGPPPLPGQPRVPQTVILVSTSGFEGGALGLAERRPDGAAVLLVGVNEAGGWTVTAPPGMEDLARLLDPETVSQKMDRLRHDIETSADLMIGGVAADRLAERNAVPRELAERALKDYAERNPGLAVRTLEGTLVLYRDALAIGGDDDTGDTMPFWEKVKGWAGMGGESAEKKVQRLSQEKALLAQQRMRAYGEIEQVEKKEAELTASFPSATPLAQKRIATEISQLRKRVERIQQLVATIDKKVNIVETGMHNLEMEKHLSKEKLASLENVATQSEEIDAGMATLDQLNEQADSVSIVGSEMSMGASDVLAELQAKFAADEAEPAKEAARPVATPAGREKAAAPPVGPPPIPAERRRVPGAAEPG
ncbi:MAG TPA: hypothetical protein VF796_02615 [Humisphaera sp.]